MLEKSINSGLACTISMRLYYLSWFQHFHNHNFNEVNLYKTVDKGITTFFFLTCLSFCKCVPSPFPFPSVSHRRRRGFSYPLLPSLIPHVSRFSCSPLQSDYLSRVQGLPLFCLHLPQRQSNKGLRQRKRE